MMRKLFLLTCALAGVATAASAQDRTPPSGILDAQRYSYGRDSVAASPDVYGSPDKGERGDTTGSIPRRRYDR